VTVLKAALHVHSTYSDGEFTLSELRAKFLAAACHVVCMADHADAFDDAKVGEYVQELARLSDDKLRFVAGLEFGCVQRMHIVGYGVTALIDSDDPETVISHIRAHDGIAVIAHPPNHLFALIEGFSVLPDGIEGWNSKYDGRYAPRPATFELITRLRKRRESLRAFYGQDLHWRKQFAGLFTLLDIPSADRALVLDALIRGAYEGSKDALRLPSNGQLSAELVAEFARANGRSQRFRAAVKSVRALLGGVVTHLPAPVKAQLRRFF
jgi:PHP domain